MTALATGELTWQLTDLHSLEATTRLDLWTDPFDPTPVWSRPRMRRAVADLPDHDVRHLVALRDGRPVLTAPLLHSSRPGGPASQDVPAMAGNVHAFGNATSGAHPSISDRDRREAYPSLAVGLPGPTHGVLVDPVLGREDRAELCSQLPDALADIAERGGHRSHGLLHLTPSFLRAVRPALGARHQVVVLGAQSYVHAFGRTFEEYLARQPGLRRRQWRMEREAYRSSANRTLISEGPRALGLDLVDLRCRQQARRGGAVDRERLERDFVSLAFWSGDNLVVFRAQQHGVTVGYSVFLRDGNTLHGRTAAFDDELLAPADCGQVNLLYFEPLVWGMSHGVTRFEMGLAGYAAKRSRGCAFEPRYGVFALPDESPLRAAVVVQDASERSRLHAECGPALIEPLDRG